MGKRCNTKTAKAIVADLLVNSPEFAKCQNQQAKITAQRKIANEAWILAHEASAAKDAKNETIHTAAYNSVINAIDVLQKELDLLVDEYEATRNRLYILINSGNRKKPTSG